MTTRRQRIVFKREARRKLREWKATRDRWRREHPEQLAPWSRPIVAHIEPRPAMRQPEGILVVMIWRANGEIQHKILPWSTRPATREALAEYMENYLDMVADGYRPEGHTSPPMPHCARITLNGRVLAEWRPKR